MDKKEVENLYKSSKSFSEIASKLGISYYNARKLMLSHGFTYKRGHAVNVSTTEEYKTVSKKIKSLYVDEKLSLRAIAEKVELSHQAVSNRLKEMGIILRKKY
jgi:hypothetical protein